MRFSPVLVGSIGLDSSVLNWFSESTLSSILLLASFSIGLSTSSACEFVWTMVSLSCSSRVLAFSLSDCDAGASRITIYWF